jgi:aminomethyltransferase
LQAGDAVFVRDVEGMQHALLFAQPLTAISALATPVQGALMDYAHSVGGLAEQLQATAARGIEPAGFAGITLFGGEAPAGTVVHFRADADVTCLFLAPGEATTPVGQATPTDVEVFIAAPNRRTIGWGDEPLAQPKAEILVKAATAEAYQVAAGDYIQILDVEGRQCSDFLAFDAKALAEGRELGLDTTATRTLMGRSSPTPGLHAKYFDAAFRPLVEVVQDTVGRGLPGARELQRQFQRSARTPRCRAAQRLASDQFFLQHHCDRDRRYCLGRALVAAGRLCAAARDDRPAVRIVGLPR